MAEFISENILTFKRLPYNSCEGYSIYVNEHTESGIKHTFLETIPNPPISLDIEEKIQLKYNSNQEWKLKDETTGVNSSSVNVYVNHNKLETKSYTFNVKNKMLYIHSKLINEDIIEVEYKTDVIKYTHKTSNKSEYVIKPIFKKNNLIGCHSII